MSVRYRCTPLLKRILILSIQISLCISTLGVLSIKPYFAHLHLAMSSKLEKWTVICLNSCNIWQIFRILLLLLVLNIRDSCYIRDVNKLQTLYDKRVWKTLLLTTWLLK